MQFHFLNHVIRPGLVHSYPGLLLRPTLRRRLLPDGLGRVPDGRGPVGHIAEHDGPRSDLGPGSNAHIAEHAGAGADQHPVPDLGVPVAGLLPRAAQRDAVEYRHVVADDGCLADDDARGVVEEDTAPNARAGVDVDPEHLGGAVLEEEQGGGAALGPEPVSRAVGLQRKEPLVVEEAMDHAVACRVAVARGAQVGASRAASLRVRRKRAGQEVAQRVLRKRAGCAARAASSD
jgi:hypothetical protein